jgi:threonylcarbamoyladenosine tRNA methylthiotransferase MtaB
MPDELGGDFYILHFPFPSFMEHERTCRLVTLGCKVNQYETQSVKELLEASGFREALANEPADLCIVNTCTVTHEADAKGRQLIRRLAQTNPGTDIIVMGCFATRAPEEVSRLPGVTCVITDKARIIEALAPYGVVRNQRPEARGQGSEETELRTSNLDLRPKVEGRSSKLNPPDLTPDPWHLTPSWLGITRFDNHRRAFVKVQDGCYLNCSFCIIPQVRPVVQSRPIGEIVAEVSGLIAKGCQEIVLTGIHLGHYGIDLSQGKPRTRWQRLWHLISRLDELPGDFRIRLSSLEAAEARGELVEALARSRRVCPHLHLCLQSGSDRILKMMKRRYRVAGYLERCRRLRDVFDKPAFTTDIIIGFPGETEEDFAATCRVVEAVGFCKLHLFSFSPRSGTPAAVMPEQVPPEVKAERRQRLLALESKLAHNYCCKLIGSRLEVLIEGPGRNRPGYVTGTSCRYVPVSLPGNLQELLGKRLPVIAERVVNGNSLIGSHPTDLHPRSESDRRRAAFAPVA